MLSIEFKHPELETVFTNAIRSNSSGHSVDDVRAKHVAVITSSEDVPIEGRVVIFPMQPLRHQNILSDLRPIPKHSTIDAGIVCLFEGERNVILDGKSISIGRETISIYRDEIQAAINARLQGTIFQM